MSEYQDVYQFLQGEEASPRELIDTWESEASEDPWECLYEESPE
jgi:hypothetical protein